MLDSCILAPFLENIVKQFSFEDLDPKVRQMVVESLIARPRLVTTFSAEKTLEVATNWLGPLGPPYIKAATSLQLCLIAR